MTLHEAMILVLREVNGGPKSTEWIATQINKRELYHRKKDDDPLPAFQVRLRAISKAYAHLFKVRGDEVSLED